MDLPEVVEKLALSGVRVIVVRLGYGFFRKTILSHACIDGYRRICYQSSCYICPHCGNHLTHSYRLSDETETIVLGEKDKYEPRCRVCYKMGKALDFRATNGKKAKNKNKNQHNDE
ncbi:MAG: hypothetical protein R2771_03600 [Saprospiraceae bacterium]